MKSFLTKFLGVLAIMSLSSVHGASNGVERIRLGDLKPSKHGMSGEQSFKKKVDISPAIKLLARIEVSAKGNGGLRIGNLDLKVFDAHDDGVYFENGLLNIDFVDLDGDGKRELVLSGIVCFTDEKGETVSRREAITFVYRFQRKGRFVLAYANTDFRLN